MKTVTARQLLITLVPSSSILALIAVLYVNFHISMITMTMDVAEVLDVHPLSGFLSNLGILLWTATASVCFFAAASLRTFQQKKIFRFLLCSAILSAYLVLDDLFRVHEWVAFRYLGVKEKFVIAALGLSVAAYFITFRGIILQTNYSVLVVATGFLTLSIVIDMTPARWIGEPGEWTTFFEDGSKWLGIACWCSYYARTSHQFFAKSMRPVLSAVKPKPNGYVSVSVLTPHPFLDKCNESITPLPKIFNK